MPNFSKFVAPTLKYSKSVLFNFNCDITSDANLSPEGSPVRIKIFFIEQPERVSSSAVYEEAKEVLKLSESYLLGERLIEKKVALTNLLDKYSQLKSLIINSNNRTYITIKNGKDLGLLSTKEVRLFPGTYTLIGKRKGYATVRKVIKLMEASSVSINCNDKI